MPKLFSTRLNEAIISKKCSLVVGLDPRVQSLPEELLAAAISMHGNTLQAAAAAVLEFNKGLIDAVSDIVPAMKPQLAFYEQLGVAGMQAFAETVTYAQEQGLLVIADGKRNDIGSTAAGYADAYLGLTELTANESARAFACDALTTNPYLGSDGVKPLIESALHHSGGLFVLVKTSNPSSSELQNLVSNGKKIYEIVGELVHTWSRDYLDGFGYSPVGAVVGATFPAEAQELRTIMPHSIFLVPGFGAQGGGPKDVVPCFNTDGLGAIVNSSRDIIFAFRKRSGDYKSRAREAALESRDAINKALGEAGKNAW
ncbi:MAG: orotidine 5''-phosphate decarboxylase subfamily 2 [Bacillota bacterium]|nr:MAG: orotidine 5''-phosphate decarboxylase subfamily 2 [Bacillota bacterium]